MTDLVEEECRLALAVKLLEGLYLCTVGLQSMQLDRQRYRRMADDGRVTSFEVVVTDKVSHRVKFQRPVAEVEAKSSEGPCDRLARAAPVLIYLND